MSLQAHYVKKSTYDSLPTAMYSISFQDMKVKIIDDSDELCANVQTLIYSHASVMILMAANLFEGPSI